MSVSVLNPIFNKIPQLLRFSTPVINKLTNVTNVIHTSNAHTLNKRMEFSFLSPKVEKEITEGLFDHCSSQNCKIR